MSQINKIIDNDKPSHYYVQEDLILQHYETRKKFVASSANVEG